MTVKTKMPIKEVGLNGEEYCGQSYDGYICVRKKGHKGLHMAGTGGRDVAKTWRQ